MSLHIFVVTEDREIWHTIGHLQGPDSITFDWDEWGDADTAGGTGHPGTGKVLDSACALDVQGNLHVLVVTDDDGGKLWHAIRSRNRRWKGFADVESGGAGQAGSDPGEGIVAVTAATATAAVDPNLISADDLRLHIIVATSKDRLFHAVWRPATGGETIWEPGTGHDAATWERRFTRIRIPGAAGPERLKTLDGTPVE
jgi:hypothetical protein